MKRNKDSTKTNSPDICQLCKQSDNCPEKYGEKITIKEPQLTVHYFCLLMASGIYQRGEEDEGVHGFLVDDIVKEVHRASKLACNNCRAKGASIGCSVKSCRKMVHFPCGERLEFIYQFTDLFPSFCRDHRPTQTCTVPPTGNLSCSICLETIEPVLSYSILKCPACHGSWFHRNCVQLQAHNAAQFFFRCTICNNQDSFQEEMHRMGIYIPERDASWEMEDNAFADLLQVYQHCDAFTCQSSLGRDFSAQSGKFEIIRCSFCGSSGTHRKCSSLKANQDDWICSECKSVVDGSATLPRHIYSPMSERQEKRKRLSTGGTPYIQSKRRLILLSPRGILQELAGQITGEQAGGPLQVPEGQVLEAALQLLRRPNFSPERGITVHFAADHQHHGRGDLRRFFRLLMERIQHSAIFKGPDGEKNLALDSQAVRHDRYYEMGCLIALNMLHGGPPPSFFSKPLYFSLFHYPKDFSFSHSDINEPWLIAKMKKIKECKTLESLRNIMESLSEYLEMAGCKREVNSYHEKYAILDDMLNFHLMVRMQLPLQRFREGLRTLGVYDQIQMAPEAFYQLFCFAPEKLCVDSMLTMFSAQYSERKTYKEKEEATWKHWQQFLQECEEGRCASSLEDVLVFATSSDTVPMMGFLPAPSVSFLPVADPSYAFPQRQPDANRVLLPVTPSYAAFKKNMEYAVCQVTVTQDS
ncbi:G2/M phase-specific E3 ubiquitin-protein ligase [Engraulis encrasicolus]|uniref:G2/M phase-specific E3 ubiquitin-protein ligase n=1 Tax=Engraulis encrasicolus TaxID=184585 RepID=UPI002FD7380C